VSHSPSPLQIATRIHHFLVRELGRGIDVEKMLHQPRYARDVLLVCDACRGSELAELASSFREARRHAERPDTASSDPPGHSARPTEWSRNTTGFGVSRPLEESAEGPEARPVEDRGWFERWRQR
jgi:hypothetical protein